MSRNTLLTGGLVAVVFAMLALAFASKPLYDTFCRVTGFGGTTQTAEAAPESIIDRNVTVRFDANVINAPVLFRPLQTKMTAQLGRHEIAFFEVTNTSDEPVNLIASYNVTPHKTGVYYNKLECFCFDERVIGANETKKLPVVFFVSPDLDDDTMMEDVRTITLSYTFFRASEFEGGAANSAAYN